jgi:hypothetical protein
MRARGLLAVLTVTGVLLAVGALALAGSVAASRAEAAQEASPPKQPAAGEAAGGAPAQAAPSRRARGRSNQTREDWWAHARDVLLSDLVLSDDQAQQIDGIIESQMNVRKRVTEIQAELRAARRSGDTDRSAALQAKLRAKRAELKDPAVRIEEMRALLTEEQRPTFDMNRARLVAETQQARDAQRRPPRRAAPGAGAPSE